MRHILYTVIFLLNLCQLYAQDNEPIEKDFVETKEFHFKESLLFIEGVATVPNVMANPGFRRTFKGIYEMCGSFNIRIFSGFSLGVGFKNALVSTQERVQNLDTRMQLYTGFMRAAYTRYHTDKTFSRFGLRFGYNNSFYTGVVPIKSSVITKNYNSLVFEPEYSINFAVGEGFAIGLFVSYAIMTTPFNPYNIAMQDYTSDATVGVTKANGMLNFGFNFHVGMGKQFKPNYQD